MIDRQRALQMDLQGRRIRIGAVTYLNSKPLVEGLAGLCPAADLILDYPSRLADQLARGALDVALIPSVESFGNPDYEVVSDACVATRGEVLSVRLYCRKHPGEVRTLALDEGSRTSAALTRVMLAERYGVHPELVSLPLGKSIQQCSADAVLLIGDRAMVPPSESFHTVWDLGAEWMEWTGLPFVFAMWVARRSGLAPEVGVQLSAARDLGVSRIPEIARRESVSMDLSEETVRDYLTKNLHFTLGPAERAGLQLFQDLVEQHGLVKASRLRFHMDCPPAVRG